MSDQYNPPQAQVADVSQNSASGVTGRILEAMRGTRPWVLLISIVVLIVASLTILSTLGTILVGIVGAGALGGQGGLLIGISLIYGVMSFIYIMMGIYLLKYSSAIGRLLQSTDMQDMEDAMESQRKFWKLTGIITIIMLVLMVLFFIAALIVPFMQLGASIH